MVHYFWLNLQKNACDFPAVLQENVTYTNYPKLLFLTNISKYKVFLQVNTGHIL